MAALAIVSGIAATWQRAPHRDAPRHYVPPLLRAATFLRVLPGIEAGAQKAGSGSTLRSQACGVTGGRQA